MKNTKQKIIDAAMHEFAEFGYKKATVRGICERAKVNVASINYHFVSKQDLYFQIFEQHINKNERYQLPDGSAINSQADLENTLREWISVMLSRVIASYKDEAKLFMQLAMQELIFPSELRQELGEKYFRHDHDSLQSILAKTTLSAHDAHIKMIALFAKCTFYIYHKYGIEIMTGDKNFLENNFDDIVETIFRETMLGLTFSHKPLIIKKLPMQKVK
ncbi:MAG: TetR/AcrR family transcriptional regulator [Lentisphaeria bacterium]|nr:TetR/AcrR family transcriptional regulator [Lentisphaeria bacterium]